MSKTKSSYASKQGRVFQPKGLSPSHRLAVAFCRGLEGFEDKASYGAWEQGRTDSQWKDTTKRRVRDEDESVGQPEQHFGDAYIFEFNGVEYRIGGAAA